MNQLRILETSNGELPLPAFMPDATRGVVRTLDAKELQDSGIKCLMVNALHLSNHPGIYVIKKHGGIHQFMGWDGPIFSDSGGFQVFSLINGSSKMGSVTNRGFVYRLTKGGKKNILTPEKSIQKQFQINADVMFCLDYCTHPEANEKLQTESVQITIEWAKRCKQEFERQLNQQKITGKPPLLLAVIQGGNSKELRKRCAERLFEIGFDGYGYGGWPVDQEGNLVEAVEMVAEGVTGDYPLHGLGIGKPGNIVQAFRMGYNLFDCVLPTRDARHNRLYIFNDKIENLNFEEKDFYDYHYIQDNRHARDTKPVDEYCDCFCCQNYSRAYLHHLLKIEDPLLNRLATIHNLRFYSKLMELLQERANVAAWSLEPRA
ncbi:MAG: tRNA guanosine(34) transglycosylase Tgt [Candidatus Aminicenantes bacterium]|jgi:queuine tRNA-ribosyltransferase